MRKNPGIPDCETLTGLNTTLCPQKPEVYSMPGSLACSRGIDVHFLWTPVPKEMKWSSASG